MYNIMLTLELMLALQILLTIAGIAMFLRWYRHQIAAFTAFYSRERAALLAEIPAYFQRALGGTMKGVNAAMREANSEAFPIAGMAAELMPGWKGKLLGNPIIAGLVQQYGSQLVEKLVAGQGGEAKQGFNPGLPK